MMDKVFDDIVDEVALEGDQGCTVDKFFNLVETLTTKLLQNTQLNIPILFDDKYKAFLWQKIKENEHLLFTEKGNTIDPSDLSYEDLVSKEILITTTEEVLDRNIYGNLKNEKKNITEKQKLLLNNITKSRSQGIAQHELGEMFKMDSKTISYHLKKLDQLGIIVKEDAYMSRMITKMLYLKRFASKPSTEIDENQQNDGVIYRVPVFKENIMKLLEKATDNIMPIISLIESLGLKTTTEKKWARSKISEMHDQGEIEKFNAYDGKKLRQCVKPGSAIRTTSTIQSHHQDDSMQVDKHYSIFRDLPSDYVFYKDVEAAGDKGLLRQELIEKYPFIDPIQFKIFFENASIPSKNPDMAKYVIYRTEELAGRIRQFRYYTGEGWKAFNKAIGNEITEPTIIPKPRQPDVLKEPTSINEIGLILMEPVRKRQYREKGEKPAKKETAKKRKASSDPPPADEDIEMEGLASAEEDEFTEPVIQVPSKRANSDVDPTANDKSMLPSAIKKAKKGSLRNTTKTRRCAILTEMVEKVHIRELDQEMCNEFKSIELDTPGGQNIARKTFDELVRHLHDQQKLKLYVSTIKKTNGLTEIKKFVLHPSLSGDSPQVKEFLENYNVQKPIMNGITKRKELRTVNMPVLPQSNANESDKSPKPIVGNSNSWRVIAIENGWIPSKWMRAKQLHETLFGFLESKGIQDGIVDMADFLKVLNLRQLMKIYGLLPYSDPKLGEFLDVDENRDISISNLPADIKAIVSLEAPRIRIRIIHLIKTLHALCVVALEENALEAYKIPPKIQLLGEGIVKDYASKGHPIRDTIQFNSVSDVQSFWRDLQSCCLEKRLTVDTIHDENDVFYNIVLVRLWKSNTLLTKEQKSILDSFIDFNTKSVPSEEDTSLRVHIARKAGLSIRRIRTYYNSILVAFKKYESQRTKGEKRQQKAQSMSASPAIAELMQASMEKRKISAAMFKLKQTEPFVESTFVASRKLRRLRVPVEPYRSQKVSRPNKPPRNPFSDIEKDVLLHAFCIMKARAETSIFYWSPISKVLTTRTPDHCRRVLHYMAIVDPNLTDTIKKLKAEWLEIYQEGIANGEIKDEAIWDTQDYDLSAFLEYFVLKLQERERQVQSIQPLPKNFSDLQAKFSIIREDKNSADNHALSTSAHCYDERAYDIPTNSIADYDESKVFVQLVMVLIKMILITPDEKYDSKDAYLLMREFSDEIIEQAVENLTAEGMLAKGKAFYGRIPGRRVNVSEKFLIMASGVLPFEFFKKAKSFHDKIAANSSIDLQISNVDGGTVAAVLDLASQEKISINFQDFEKYIKPRKSIYYPRASAVSMRTAFIYRGLDLRIIPNNSLIVNHETTHYTKSIGMVSVPKHEEIKEFLHVLEDKYPLCKALYDIIYSFGKAGASMSDIRSTFAYQRQEEEEALLFFETLEILTNHKPPLVQIMGFEHLRYVASEFLSSWFIKQSNVRYVLPLMWYDTTGSIIPIALEGCANATMSHILKKPGITFANLRDRFQGFFTEFELYHILKYLLESKSIIARKIQRKIRSERMSIFEKRPLFTTSMNYTLNNDEITCYWLARNYYL